MSEKFEPVIVGFLCNWCSYRAADLAGTARIKYAPNMRPILRPRRQDSELVESYFEERRDEFACPVADDMDYVDYEQFLGEVKTAMVLEAWINESSEADLLEKYSVAPGDRYSAVTSADWLLYSTYELARVLGVDEHRGHLGRLRVRVRYGVSPIASSTFTRALAGLAVTQEIGIPLSRNVLSVSITPGKGLPKSAGCFS